jgi:hypothetical protein
VPAKLIITILTIQRAPAKNGLALNEIIDTAVENSTSAWRSGRRALLGAETPE